VQSRVQSQTEASKKSPTNSGGSDRSQASNGLKGASYDEAVQMLTPGAEAKPAAQAQNPGQSAADAKSAKAPPPATFGAVDPKGILDGVHPALVAKIKNLIANAHAKGLNIKLQEGMRSFERQNELYAQGRTKPGSKVTKAKGGQSFHNYGTAVDVVFHGALPYAETHAWDKLGEAGEAAGLAWGGHWGDRPHFELGGVKFGTLKAWYDDGGMQNVWTQVSALHGGPSFEQEGAGSEQAPGGGGKTPGGGGKTPGGGGIYKVKPGETLGAIAEKLLGNVQRWRDIAKANGIVDPEKLRVGQELRIPGWRGGGGGDAGTAKAATHVVKPGDTLVAIATRYLGNSNGWRSIAEANGIADPRVLKIGLVLKIPGGGAGEGAEKKAAPRTYVVKPGDTLSAIAEKLLGSAKKWRDLATANNISDPTRLKVGTTLTIA